MKKFFLVLFILAALAGAGFYFFGDSVFTKYVTKEVTETKEAVTGMLGEGLKIGVVDRNKVLMESPQLNKLKSDFEKKFSKREKELVDLQKKFQSDVEAFSKNSPTMKSDKKKEEEKKILAQQQKIQALQVQFQKDAAEAQNKAMKDILGKVENIINGIAISKKFDLVVDKSAVPYSKQSMDITDEVVSQLKSKK